MQTVAKKFETPQFRFICKVKKLKGFRGKKSFKKTLKEINLTSQLGGKIPHPWHIVDKEVFNF